MALQLVPLCDAVVPLSPGQPSLHEICREVLAFAEEWAASGNQGMMETALEECRCQGLVDHFYNRFNDLMAVDPRIFPLSIHNLTWRHALRLGAPNGAVANNLTGPTKPARWTKATIARMVDLADGWQTAAYQFGRFALSLEALKSKHVLPPEMSEDRLDLLRAAMYMLIHSFDENGQRVGHYSLQEWLDHIAGLNNRQLWFLRWSRHEIP